MLCIRQLNFLLQILKQSNNISSLDYKNKIYIYLYNNLNIKKNPKKLKYPNDAKVSSSCMSYFSQGWNKWNHFVLFFFILCFSLKLKHIIFFVLMYFLFQYTENTKNQKFCGVFSSTLFTKCFFSLGYMNIIVVHIVWSYDCIISIISFMHYDVRIFFLLN